MDFWLLSGPEVPALARIRLSPFGIPLWRGPGTSPRKFPPEISGGAEIPAYRPEVPARGNFGRKKRLSHFWDPSLEGSRNFPPEVPPGNFRWCENSGQQAGSSGPWKFRVEKRLSHFWDPSLEGSQNFPPEVPPEISGGAEIPASWPEVPARGNFGWKYG